METVTTAINAWVSSVAKDMTGMVTTNIPVILTVVGVGIAVTFGIKFVKRITSKA